MRLETINLGKSPAKKAIVVAAIAKVVRQKLALPLPFFMLPQVINVLLGDMSLVGPRPYLPREKNMIGDYLDIICQVQPGITGIWQVSGRSDVNFAGRLELDEWYVNNHSIWVDIKCLLKTARIVLFSKGAY